MKSCVHIYCGDGKGKTSAAAGLMLRAAGRGRRIVAARFLKNEDSGEVHLLRSLPGVEVLPCEKEFGFYFQMSEAQKQEAGSYYRSLFEKAWLRAAEAEADMLVLDEIMAVCNYGMVEEQELLRRIKERPEKLEVVLTGRNPSGVLCAAADYVSEIRQVKHPFTEGIAAREGIEY